MSSLISLRSIFCKLLKGLVQIHGPHVQYLLSAEGKELVREGGASHSRRSELAHIGHEGVCLLHLHLEEPGKAGDGGEDVVEIVRYTAGQVSVPRAFAPGGAVPGALFCSVMSEKVAS